MNVKALCVLGKTLTAGTRRKLGRSTKGNQTEDDLLRTPKPSVIRAAPVSFRTSSQHQDAVTVGASLIYKAWHSGRGKVQVRVTFPWMGRRQYVQKVVPQRARNTLAKFIFSKMLLTVLCRAEQLMFLVFNPQGATILYLHATSQSHSAINTFCQLTSSSYFYHVTSVLAG